jgi:hypothetical protein
MNVATIKGWYSRLKNLLLDPGIPEAKTLLPEYTLQVFLTRKC